MIGRRVALGVISTTLACLVWTASAGAAGIVRYAKPGASGAEPCAQGAPCSLTNAIEGHAPSDVNDGDSVVVLSGFGNYAPGSTITITKQMDIGGEPGKPAPTITGNLDPILFDNALAPAAHVHDLKLVSSGLSAFAMGYGTYERLFVEDTSAAGTACNGSQSVFADSVCLATGTNSEALAAFENGLTVTLTLRNATIVDTAASGQGMRTGGVTSGSLTVDALNTIARGPGIDVRTSASGTSTNTVALADSNYATVDNSGGGSSTPAGTNGNQTASPLFANPAVGDLHELSSSPTIDAGVAAPNIGSLDLDRNPRTQASCLGGAPLPDIGAYEFGPINPPLAACNVFKIGGLKLNKKKGTADLTLTVPGSGSLNASGKGLKGSGATATAAGDITLKVKAAGRSRAKLADKGKLKLKVRLDWTPTGGSAAPTQTDKITLKKK